MAKKKSLSLMLQIHLKKGERLWWFGDDVSSDAEMDTSSTKVRLWKTLDKNEKLRFVILGYAFFPEILGSSQDKYDNFSLWLVSRYGIVSTSLRDSFSAGGKRYITVNGLSHLVSQSVYHLFQYRDEIMRQIERASEETLRDVWNVSKIKSNSIEQWIELLIKNSPENKLILLKLLDESCVIEL